MLQTQFRSFVLGLEKLHSSGKLNNITKTQGNQSSIEREPMDYNCMNCIIEYLLIEHDMNYITYETYSKF